MAPQDSSSSTRFYPDVSGPTQPSATHHDKCNGSPPGLYPTRSALAPRNGLRGENATDGSNDAIQMQLAYEIMQHKTTIQRIANVFAV